MVDFNIINFDVSILGNYYGAKYGRSTSSLGSSALSSNRGSSVITPWSEEDDSPLLRRYNTIRNKSNFINENTSAVKEAGLDKDNKALFTLYAALSDLRTIAEYASSNSTPANLLAGLSSQFSKGISQIDNYIRAAELDKLILLTEEKKSYVTTDAGLGKTNHNISGGIVAAVSKTSAIVGLNGDEVFTINIKANSTTQDDVVIDLSEISGEVTLESLKSLINSKIGEFTTVNGTGDTVGKYKTRVQIDEASEGKFSLTFKVDGIEQLTFSAAQSEPALIIAGTTKSGDFSATESGTITKYKNLDGSGLVTSYSHEIVGIDANGFVIPATDEDGEETTSVKQVFQTAPVAIEIDRQGNSYVVGTTEGDLGGQLNGAKTSDVFLSKYSSNGDLLWSRLLGASDEAEAFALTIDANDNAIIAGKTNEELVASDVFSGTDSFVTKYSNSGEEIWTKQLDTIATDQANSLTVDEFGDIYFTGQVSGRLDVTTTDNGGTDAIIVKLSGVTGATYATAQFGGAANDTGSKIAIAGDGNILIASKEDGIAVIRKLDKGNLNNTLATYNLGDLGGGEITGLSVFGSEIYISGSTLNGSLNGGSVVGGYSGGKDGFVTKLNDTGSGFSADFTTFIGTAASDTINALKVENGSIYVAGATNGTLSGENKTGISDGFMAKIDATTGATIWQEQLRGLTGYNESTAIAFSQNGSSVLDKLGLPTGTVNKSQTRNIETQTSARIGDHFYISINDGRKIKIDIRDGDTFDRLAKRINVISPRNLKASVTFGENGPQLKFEAKNGATIDFSAGAEGRDALQKLGLKERSIIAPEVLFDLDDSDEIDPSKLGGVFALALNTGFAFGNRKEAEFILSKLENALEVIKSAHRSLTFDPVKAQLLQQSKLNIGEAPAHLQAQVARYQDGLQRVLAVTGGTII